MRADPIGLYVHVPFCLKKCNYCDFCSYTDLDAEVREQYINALISEIEGYRGRNISADTVFFGGGTPALLKADESERIFKALHSSFNISRTSEITFEANPKTVSREKLSALGSLGVNRISMGMQSIHENELKILGRIHNYNDFLVSYEAVRDAGFDNVNVDIMYGIPEQTENSFCKTLDCVLALAPEHLSLYSLILEEGTPLHAMKESLCLPSEDTDVMLYNVAVETLAKAGYSHYEISNYSRTGYESRHNLKYWRAGEYLGFGAAAYSYFDGERFGNSRDLKSYINESSRREYTERITTHDEQFEYIMLRLRLREGFSISDYRSRFGKNPEFIGGEYFNSLVGGGYIIMDGDRISLSDKGMYVSNTIIAELT